MEAGQETFGISECPLVSTSPWSCITQLYQNISTMFLHLSTVLQSAVTATAVAGRAKNTISHQSVAS